MNLTQQFSDQFTCLFLNIIATTCYGTNKSEFPSINLFAVASDEIWNGGVTCGRQYLVKCISGSVKDACDQNQTIQVKIDDYIGGILPPPSAFNTTMVLSNTAFVSITNLATSFLSINIEYQP